MPAIRAVVDDDASAICAIYNPYIENSIITFEEQVLDASDMRDRISDTLSAGLPWFVAEKDSQICGYAYASTWKSRCSYRYSAEVTVYLAEGYHGQGIGARLLQQLIDELSARGYHTALAGIALPNSASVALHEKLGFEPVARFREVGFKFGNWIDVGYWQRVL